MLCGGKSRRTKYGERFALMEIVFGIVVGKCQGKRPLKGSRSRLKYDFNIQLREMECSVVKWIHLAPDRLVSDGVIL
jgi:hypothetical protein